MSKEPYHHGDLQRALVQAGLELLDKGGLDAVGVRAAARAVGVSHAAPARHFPDATSYLAALAGEAYLRLAQAQEAAASQHSDPLLAMRAVGTAYVTFGIQYPHLFRLLTHPSLADKSRHPELEAASLRAFAPLRASIRAAQAVGAVNGADTDQLALGAWAMVHGAAMLIVDDQLRAKGYTQSPGEITDVVTTVLFGGLRP